MALSSLMWMLAGEAVFTSATAVVVEIDGSASRRIISGDDILLGFGYCCLVVLSSCMAVS